MTDVPQPATAIYEASPVAMPFTALRQGEIITDLTLYRIRPEHVGSSTPELLIEVQPITLVLTQDCDLEQDFRVRSAPTPDPDKPIQSGSDKLIPCVLLCEVFTAEELFGRVQKVLGRKGWDRIQQNNDVRYHYLQRPGPDCDSLGQGLAELAIDFKKYTTIRTDELYQRLRLGVAKRRCVLRTPYLENLSQRFAYYLSRVALPEQHFSEPAASPS